MRITSKHASIPLFSSPLRRVPTVALVIMTAALTMGITGADAEARAAGAALHLAQSPPAVSADEAAAVVRAASGGRILDVRLTGDSKRPIYRVKVLLDGGRVRVYHVDASNGRLLE